MDILDLARELGKAIQEDEKYIEYRMKEQKVECKEDLQKIIEKFNLKKVEINLELSKENSDKEKLDELNKEIGDLYGKIMADETMQDFNKAKQEFDVILNNVSYIISESAAGKDPYTIEIPNGADCVGNCASCGGCH